MWAMAPWSAEIRKHTDWVTALEFSPDGVLLATADRAGGVWVWEAGTDREFQALEGHKAAVTAMSCATTPTFWARPARMAQSPSGRWKTANASRASPPIPAVSTLLAFLHDGRFVSGGRDHPVKLWGGGGNPLRQFEPCGELVMKVAATHDGGRIVAGDWSGEVRLRALPTASSWADWPRIRPRWKWPSSSDRPRQRRHVLWRNRLHVRPLRHKSCSTKSGVPLSRPRPRQRQPRKPLRALPRKKPRWRKNRNS